MLDNPRLRTSPGGGLGGCCTYMLEKDLMPGGTGGREGGGDDREGDGWMGTMGLDGRGLE